MKTYPHIAARIFNTPLMILPTALDAIVAGIGDRLLIGADSALLAARAQPEMIISAAGARAEGGYQVIDGVAVLDVAGILAHKSQVDMNTCQSILGYQDIARQFDAAQTDSAVKAILFNLDSPGGEVSGVFDLAAKIFAARGKKPMAAIASDMACSACYLLASAVGQIAVTQTATVGSVGVVMRHVDMSAAMKAGGFDVSFIFAGAHKVDGNPYQPLPDAVRADLQFAVDGMYTMFVDACAKYRGIDASALRKTEARVYQGAEAVKAGMADFVSTPDQMIEQLRAGISLAHPSRASARATHSNRSTSMSEHEQASGGAEARPVEAFSKTDVDQARAEGVKTGATQERERVSAILGHAEAQGRAELAHTCIAQGLSVEQAGALLAVAPRADHTAGTNQFAAQMAALGNPAVKPDAESGDAQQASAVINAMVGMINSRAKA